MRELSTRERAFLERRLPGSTTGGTTASQGRYSASLSPLDRVGSLLRTVVNYIPLVIGSITLLFAALIGYLYIWGRDFFKISEVDRLNSDGTLKLMDKTSRGWLQGTLDFFDAAPWIILGTIVVGLLLMGLSMILVRKRNG